jgi:sulfite oxidase
VPVLFRHWSWTLWEAEVELPEAARKPGGSFQVAVRAVDADYAEQPEDPARLWNIRGVLNNAWHRIKLHVAA